MTRDPVYQPRALGNIPGNKLSAPKANFEQLKRLQSAESHWERLDRSGWGPGGRRFKSCLPDFGKALQSRAFLRSQMGPFPADGDQFGDQFLQATATDWYEASVRSRPHLREVGQLLRTLAHG